MRRSFPWVRLLLVVVTVASAWLTGARLHLSSDLSTLFPESGDAGALVRWNRAFGGRDPALVLVHGDVPDDVAGVADAIAESLRHDASIERVLVGVPALTALTDPTLAWAYAGPAARARLAEIVTPLGMRQRLEETRALLLAPAADDRAEAWIARDPLRLAQVPWESRAELAAGAASTGGGTFVADGGRARLVVAQPRGSAFVSDDARAVVDGVTRAVSAAARPGVEVELAGGHAIALATEEMIRRDLELSGTLSLVLASVAFVLTFRRVRALAAVLPPLVLGTLWTTGLAALFPAGLSVIAIAFAAVVVGVGVDTGVHVYAAFLAARRDGLPPRDAAIRARDDTWRPTLTAAAVAGVAFASLGLSGLRAMQQLGILCGAGELLTAVAIVLVTPEIGVWLEPRPPPPPRPSRWTGAIDRMTSTRPRALAALAVCALPVAIVAVVGWPAPADALVAIRPHALAPLVAEEHIRARFGGRAGQWIVLSSGADLDGARTRADRVADALEPLQRSGVVDGFDALGTFAPSVTTQRARLAERDALDLPGRRAALEDALRRTGFDSDRLRVGARSVRPALVARRPDAPGRGRHRVVAAGPPRGRRRTRAAGGDVRPFEGRTCGGCRRARRDPRGGPGRRDHRLRRDRPRAPRRAGQGPGSGRGGRAPPRRRGDAARPAQRAARDRRPRDARLRDGRGGSRDARALRAVARVRRARAARALRRDDRRVDVLAPRGPGALDGGGAAHAGAARRRHRAHDGRRLRCARRVPVRRPARSGGRGRDRRPRGSRGGARRRPRGRRACSTTRARARAE